MISQIQGFPVALYVDGNSITPCAEDWEDIDDDPRGVFLMWEPPDPYCKYVMGLDPTVGITGWSRAVRTPNDDKTDNGAIEIIKVGGLARPLFERDMKTGMMKPAIDPNTKRQMIKYIDVQVGEYAAPVDAVEIAQVANVLGRIYKGDADDMCQLIYEAYPGPGLLTTQELIRLNYSNLWMWEYIDNAVEETDRPGWRSTPTSQRLLWQRSRRHLMQENIIVQSRWLLEEYTNAEIDLEKMRARAASGYHDDRFQACNMATWAAHKWAYDTNIGVPPVTTTPTIDYQRFAPTLGDDTMSYKEWRESFCDDWE